MKIKGKGQLIPARNGKYYLGVIIDYMPIDLEMSINMFIIKNELTKYKNNLKKRNDNHNYHMTIVPFLSSKIDSMFLVECLTTEFEIDVLGISTIKKDDKQTWFCPIKCEQLVNLGKKYNMNIDNLHITIVFKKSDIHNVDKTDINLIKF